MAVENANNYWLAISFCAPVLWALVNIADIYFVESVYKDELDGTIISSLFQIIPWSAYLIFVVANPGHVAKILISAGEDTDAFILAIIFGFLGGMLFIASFYFYFKALFNHNDGAFLQIVWNLSAVIIPFLMFILFKEALPPQNYIGIAVILSGVYMISMNDKFKYKFSKRYFNIMFWAVVLLSLSMIFEDRAYEELSNRGFGTQGFLFGFFIFSLGGLFSGILYAIFGKRNPWQLIKKHYKIFLLMEGTSFLGTFASQKAIDSSPSVSFVAAIETFVPVFIMLFSWLIVLYLYLRGEDKKKIAETFSNQFQGIRIKIIATIVMAIGVYLLS